MPRLPHRVPVATAVILLVGWCVKCHTTPEPDRPEALPPAEAQGAPAEPAGPRLEAVRYELAWDTSGVELLPEGGGWTVESDLGYRVRVTRGFVTTYSLSLVACSDIVSAVSPAVPPAPTAVAVLFGEAFGVRTAWAGHQTTVDPSTLPRAIVESMAAPGEVVATEVTFPSDVYCRVHYLVARAPEGSLGLPDEPSLVGTSLFLEGEVSGPHGEVLPLHVDTASAFGSLTDLSAVAVEASAEDAAGLGPSEAVVRVDRHLATLFDGVDFSDTDGRAIAHRLLSNLVNGARIRLIHR